jgi:glutathione synthase
MKQSAPPQTPHAPAARTLLVVLNGYEFRNAAYFQTKGFHDTGLQLVRAAKEMGSTVFVAYAAAEPEPAAGSGAEATFAQAAGAPLEMQEVLALLLKPGDSSFQLGPPRLLTLDPATIPVMLIRQDPPSNDQRYLDVLRHAQWFEQRGGIAANSTRVLAEIHEKRSVYVPDFQARHPGLVSPVIETRDAAAILAFWRHSRSGTVLKPTDGFGGIGVTLLKADLPEATATTRIGEYLAQYAAQPGETVFAQECIPEVEHNGDIRLLAALHPNGTITAGAARRVNNTGDIVANMAAGGKAMPTDTLAKPLAVALVRDTQRILAVLSCEYFTPYPDLSLVGVDLLYDPRDGTWKVGELNVTAPTVAYEIREFTGVDVAAAAVEAAFGRVHTARQRSDA